MNPTPWHPSSSGPTSMNIHNDGDRTRPQGQSNNYGPTQSSHQPSQSSGPVLPPPPGPFYPSAGPSGSGMPSIAGMPQSPPNPQQHRHLPPQEPLPGAQCLPGPPSMAPYPMQGMPPTTAGQALPRPGYDRDREIQDVRERDMREREYEHQARQRDARERDMRERGRDGPPHQGHAEPLLLHQPVAVGPQVRSAIHGLNGLLGSAGPPGGLNGPAPLLNSQIPLFGPHFDNGPRGGIPPGGPPPPQNGMPFGGMPQAAMPALGHGQQPILNDALSYLDQVKVQFAGEPNVYNQFLDIMKDFKSQAIDTPGVIRRVSSLFAGNPNLIQGFNTFLPPGYRIECGTADDPNAIRVTTPMGSQVSPMGSTLRPLSNPRPGPIPSELNNQVPPMYDMQVRADAAWLQRPADQNDVLLSPTSRAQPPPLMYGHQLGAAPGRLTPPEVSVREQGGPVNGQLLAQQQEQKAVTQLQNAATIAGGESLSQLGLATSPGAEITSPMVAAANVAQSAAAANEKRGPVEFNHAISYVNKIKNRYSGQPEIYKQFLEILQTYQRESKPIQDVYAQVTLLFSDAPDLLQDFKQFLPESAAHAKAAAARQAAEDMTMTSNLRGEPGYNNQIPQPHQTPRPEQHRLPPVGKFAPTPSANRDVKRKRGDRVGSIIGAQSNMQTSNAEASNSGGRSGFAPNKRVKSSQLPPQSAKPTTVQQEEPAVSPTLVPALPVPLPPTATNATASADELAFFDRVKKFVGNKNTMNEFLKLCNLYSQDLIDKNSLVFRVSNFLGTNPDLLNWFKAFVDYDGKDQIIENRAKPASGRVVLNNCRAYGPSYRLLPKRERSRKCSGRDDLCQSVLNDEWASHPTWASEDSGFIAHRKNQFEETLHRIEEERHDYDHFIAVVERSVQLLSPMAQQKQMMSEAEIARWKLPRDFGGQSQSIIKRALAKIYHREAALQVMSEMLDRPAVVIPVLLLRFKHKLEEWKASHREWEKVWRDATQKFFWRSLDHQGINAKMADKRQFQTKTLQNEIHVKYEEQRRQRLLLHNTVPAFQALYSFTDVDVIIDASRLLLTYAEHTHSTDFPKLTLFIKEFIPLFFGLDLDNFQSRIRDIFVSTPSNEEMDEDITASDDALSARGRKTNGKKPDLLRDVLAKTRRSARGEKEGSVASESRASTPDVASIADEEMTDAPAEPTEEEEKPKTWINHPSSGNLSSKRDIKPNEPFKRTTYNLYANLPIYCFFRMFVILYERLNHLKLNEKKVHESVRRAKSLKAAIDLKIIDKHPDRFFADTTPTANYYSQMLALLEDFLKGDGRMDMAHIEEVLRRYYLQTGWMLYSFDKMLSALVRFAIAVLSNDGKEKSSEILQLFTKDRRKETTTHQDELLYRKQVEKYVKDGDVYRVAFNMATQTTTIRILKPTENTFDPLASDPANGADEALLTPEQRWTYYISSYTSLDPTEGVNRASVPRPLVYRTLRALFKRYGASDEVVNALGAGIGVAALVTNAPPTSVDAGLEWFVRREISSTDANGTASTAIGAIYQPLTLGDADRLLERLRSRETLGLRVNPANYKIHWSVVESEEWWLAAPESLKTASAASATQGKERETATTVVTIENENAASTDKTAGTEAVVDDVAQTNAAEIATAAAKDAQPANLDATTVTPKDEPTDAATIDATKPTSTTEATSKATSSSHSYHGSKDGEDKDAAFEEKFLMNNRWMAGLSRDEVDGRNSGYRGWREGVARV